MIRPVAELPQRWIDEGRHAGAHIDLTLKSPWQLFAAWEGDHAQGFIGLLLTSPHRATIRGWYVFPNWRELGIGGSLLRFAVDWAITTQRGTLEIRTVRNVEWLGFQWTGYTRPGGNRERRHLLRPPYQLPLIRETQEHR